MNRTRVLIVDDEELVRRHLRQVVESVGYSVFEADDGYYALAIFEAERPDLVLTDLRMPLMDGHQLIKYLAKNYPETPVVAVSGVKDLQHALQAIRNGAWDYLVKPVEDLALFQLTVSRALERGLLLTENRCYQEKLESMVAERTRQLQIFKEVAVQNPRSIIITKADGKIVYANPQLVAFSGLVEEELFEKTPCLLIFDVADQAFCDQIWQYVSQNRIWEGTLKAKHKDGDSVPMQTLVSAIYNEHGEVTHYLLLLEDITEKLRLEYENELSRARLVQADKLCTVGLLASGITHDINNPNSLIMRNAELLACAWQSAIPIFDDFYRENGDFQLSDFMLSEATTVIPRLYSGIIDGSRKIKEISERLRNFNRQDCDRQTENFDLNQVVRNAINILNYEIRHRCQNFAFKPGDNVPLTRGSACQVEQVVINLIMNSLQSLPDKNSGILVTTKFDENENRLLLTVIDEGCGMSEEVLAQINEPFFTTKQTTGGTGLGLYICNSLLSENRGELHFESKIGSGTTVTVLLAVS